MTWTGEPTASSFALAAVLWAVLATGPGWLVVTALDPRRPALDRAAIAPLVSIAIAFAVPSWLGVFGVPRPAVWAVPALAVSSLAAAGVMLRRSRARTYSGTAATPWRVRLERSRPTIVWVGLALGLALGLWILAIATSRPGFSLVIPNSDGNSHGLFVARILLTGSVDPRDIAVLDAASPGGTGLFYPLGLHVLGASIGSLTTVASALLIPLTVLGSAWGVIGAVAITRRFASPSAAHMAGFAAAALVPWVPFGQVDWGPVPMVAALSLVPAAVLAVIDVRPKAGLLVPGLALAGLLAVHTTEALVVAVLVGLTLLRGRATSAEVVWRAILAGILALAVVGPLTVGLLAGGASRPADPSRHVTWIDALGLGILRPFFTASETSGATLSAMAVASLVVLVVAIVGGARAWRVPLGRAVVLVVLATSALGIACDIAAPGLLAAPWYGNGDRLAAQAAALLPCLVGVGVISLWAASRRARRRRIVTAGVAGIVGVVMAAQAVVTANGSISQWSVVTPADRAAFAWLASHVRPGERVLNDHRDGSVWAYASSGGVVVPVFGAKPGGGFENDPAFADRLLLRSSVAKIATDEAVREAARTWSVRYVLVGERTVGDSPRLIDADSLPDAAGLREVFRSGDARVYEITAR